MLVLTRKNRESVVVGSPDDVERPITITVLDIRGGRVKLGFQVANSVTVLRGELWEQQQAEGQPEPAEWSRRGCDNRSEGTVGG